MKLLSKAEVGDRIMDKYGLIRITAIHVCRTPLGDIMMGALNGLTLGQMKKRIRGKPYDKLYHLAMHLTLESGARLTLEKNEVVTVTDSVTDREGSELMEVPIKGDHSLLSIVSKMIATYGLFRFDAYSAKDRNCQKFIHDNLVASDLIKPGDEISEFVLQDIRSLFDNANYLRKLTNTVTGLAGAIGKRIPTFQLRAKARERIGLRGDEAGEYLKNPLLLGYDTSSAILPVVAPKKNKDEDRAARQRLINVRGEVKKAGKYLNPVTLVGMFKAADLGEGKLAFSDTGAKLPGDPSYILGGVRGNLSRDQKVYFSERGIPFYVDGSHPDMFESPETTVPAWTSVHTLTGTFFGSDFNNEEAKAMIRVIEDKTGKQWALFRNSSTILDIFHASLFRLMPESERSPHTFASILGVNDVEAKSRWRSYYNHGMEMMNYADAIPMQQPEVVKITEFDDSHEMWKQLDNVWLKRGTWKGKSLLFHGIEDFPIRISTWKTQTIRKYDADASKYDEKLTQYVLDNFS